MFQELYNYDEGASKEKTSNDGIRLVGAARGKTARYPFVVAFTTIAPEKGERAQCTGLLMLIQKQCIKGVFAKIKGSVREK